LRGEVMAGRSMPAGAAAVEVRAGSCAPGQIVEGRAQVAARLTTVAGGALVPAAAGARLQDEAAVAVAALDPAAAAHVQVDLGMAERTAAAVAGHGLA